MVQNTYQLYNSFLLGLQYGSNMSKTSIRFSLPLPSGTSYLANISFASSPATCMKRAFYLFDYLVVSVGLGSSNAALVLS